VAAFGSPLGLQQSVSEGIVSAVRESKELRTLGPIDVNARLIQTTTPISHGNSGGPLVDMKGMVVGVNTMTFRPLGGENVNFAVAAVELPPLLLAKNETPSPLPASDPAAGGVRRILRRARPTWMRAITIAPSPTTPRPSGSIRKTPRRISGAVGLLPQGRLR
jgi:hypothetical protein